jgi:hypothetical protein
MGIHMKLTQICASAVAGLFLMVAGAANAAIVYQSIPNLFTTNANGGQWCSTCSGTYIATAQFTLSQATGIDSVTFAAFNSSGYLNNPYTIRVYNNAAGTIGSEIFNQTISAANFTNGGTSPNGETAFLTGALTGLNLSAGSYWIGFQGLPNGALSSYYAPGQSWFLQQYTTFSDQDLGIILTGGSGVPAPGALALLGLGLLGIGALRRKKAT